jgi:hypothetical protein
MRIISSDKRCDLPYDRAALYISEMPANHTGINASFGGEEYVMIPRSEGSRDFIEGEMLHLMAAAAREAAEGPQPPFVFRAPQSADRKGE